MHKAPLSSRERGDEQRSCEVGEGGGLAKRPPHPARPLHGVSHTLATTTLTAYLLCSATGVLLGGFVVSRTSRHGLVTALGLAIPGLAALSAKLASSV
jgi:hypothetical protein